MASPASKPLGNKCIIKLKHIGCWASELTRLFVDKGRTDLELLVFLLSSMNDWYKVLTIVRSQGGEEIGTSLEREITDFLFDHGIIRAFKPRLYQPDEHISPLLVCIHDSDVSGAYRILEDLDATFHPYVGMLVQNGVESVVSFVTDVGIYGRAIAAFSEKDELFEIVSSDFDRKYYYESDIADDPYFLFSCLISDPTLKQEVINAYKRSEVEFNEILREKAWWLVPLLKEILRWVWEYPNDMSYIR